MLDLTLYLRHPNDANNQLENEDDSLLSDSAQEATVLFSICSQENLHKFHEDAEDIKLVFTDVNIPVTEQHRSQGISQPYTTYCIQVGQIPPFRIFLLLVH